MALTQEDDTTPSPDNSSDPSVKPGSGSNALIITLVVAGAVVFVGVIALSL
jgi:hypothetical protein